MKKYCFHCMSLLDETGKCLICGSKKEENPVPHHLKPGTLLENRYLVGEAIGQGGFGITYIGMDTRLELKVAIKEYYPSGYVNRNTEVTDEITVAGEEQLEFIEKGKARFLSEAKILAEFHDHEGVVDVRDFFEANQTAYLVMEYLEGKNLGEKLKESLFSIGEILSLMYLVMDAMAEIHRQNIIHRDISPDNLMLLPNGKLKLMDFGAARQTDYDNPKSISIVLKNGYAPAEQYRPKGKQGPWTDVYGLCATIYKSLTGLLPDNALQREYKDEMRWPSELEIEISARQEAVLKKGMAVKAEDRYASMEELKEAFLENGETEEIHSLKLRTIEEEEEKQVQPKKKRFVIGLGIFAVLFLFGIAFAISRTGFFSPNQNPLACYDEETMYHITMTADEKMPVKKFSRSVEQIKERLDLLADGEKYGLEVAEDRIELVIPKACFGEKAVKDVMLPYICRAGDLYAYCKTEGIVYPPDQFEIGRDEIESVTMEEGKIPGVKGTDYGFEEDTYPYIKMTLTDECAEKNRSKIAEWGDALSVGFDLYHTYYYYCITFSAGDGKTFYLINTDLEEKYYRLLYNNLCEEPLVYGFSFSIEINDVEWENAKTAERAGKNQCSKEDLKEKTITIVYETSYEDLTEGDWLDITQTFKERLDALGQPYAVGWKRTKEGGSFVVRTGLLHMGESVIYWLCSTSLSIRSGMFKYPVLDISKLKKMRDGNSAGVSLEIQNYMLENRNAASGFETFTEDLLQKNQNKLVLFADDLPYCTTDIQEPITNGILSFKDLSFNGKAEDAAWKADLLDAIWNGTKFPHTGFRPSSYQFDMNEKGEMASADQFGVSNSDAEEEIKTKILKTDPKAEVRFSKSAVLIGLNLDMDETLPQKSTSLVKEIFEASDFISSDFQEIQFYLIEENNKETERARIFFSKTYSGQPENKKVYLLGDISLSGMFAGGRLERYQEEFQRIVEKDAFYREKVMSEYAWEFGD